jgi:hypothetical protein
MSSRPWLKFYPGDWRSDPALRMCSLAARGLWIDMLCLMHEADPRGSLLVNGKPVKQPQLASLVGVSVREVTACLNELEAAGVFSRDNDAVYSRRMRRDTDKAEQDKANGKGGGNPALKRGVNPPDNGGDKAQKLEARGQKSDSQETNKKRGSALDDELAFAGNVVRLNPADFNTWRKSYGRLIDLDAHLASRDAWLSSDKATDSDRKNWFVSTSAWLANKASEAKARASPPAQQPAMKVSM